MGFSFNKKDGLDQTAGADIQASANLANKEEESENGNVAPARAGRQAPIATCPDGYKKVDGICVPIAEDEATDEPELVLDGCLMDPFCTPDLQELNADENDPVAFITEESEKIATDGLESVIWPHGVTPGEMFDIQIEVALLNQAGTTDFNYQPQEKCASLAGVNAKSSNLIFDITHVIPQMSNLPGNSLFINHANTIKKMGRDMLPAATAGMSGHDVVRTALGKYWVRRPGGQGSMPPIIYLHSFLGPTDLTQEYREAISTHPTSDEPPIEGAAPLDKQEQRMGYTTEMLETHSKVVMTPDAGAQMKTFVHNPNGPFGSIDEESPFGFTEERIVLSNITEVPTTDFATYESIPNLDEDDKIQLWAEWKKNNDLPILKMIQARVESDSLSPETRFKYDHVHKILTPFTTKELENQNLNNPLVVDVKPQYNFLSENYENYIGTNITVHESILPHLLLTVTQEQANSLDPALMHSGKQLGVSDDHLSFLTLGGVMDKAYIQVLSNPTGDITQPRKLADIKDQLTYFPYWAQEKQKLSINDSAVAALQEKYKKQILLPKEWGPNLYNSIEKRKFNFPMLVNLEFTTPKAGSVMNLLRSLNPETGERRGGPAEKIIGGIGGDQYGEFPGLWYALLRLFIDGKDAVVENSYVAPNSYSSTGPKTFRAEFKEIDFLQFLEKLDPAILHQALHSSIYALDKTHGLPYLQDVTDDVATIIPKVENSNLSGAIELVEGFKNDAINAKLWRTMNEFIENFRNIVKEKTRTYAEVLEGKLACSETLFWRITKHDVDEDGKTNEEPLQEFYYPNLPETDLYELVDSQVKYGKDYVYRIRAINIVFGTEYEYKNEKRPIVYNQGGTVDLLSQPDWEVPVGQPVLHPESGLHPCWQDVVLEDGFEGYWFNSEEINDHTKDFLTRLRHSDASGLRSPASFATPSSRSSAQQVEALIGIKGFYGDWSKPYPDAVVTNWNLQLDVISRPSVRIMEVPYYSVRTKVLDKPPLAPHISAVPYKDVNDKFLLMLEGNTGTETATPVVLRPEDGEKIDKQLMAQGNPFPPVLTFQADDTPEAFEIFRIEPPNTEEEIANNEVKQYYPPTSYESFETRSKYTYLAAPDVSSKSIIEEIEPNKTYYYTFRTKDFHDNISNPSVVYEIKMVDDSGTNYLSINLYEFPKIKRSNTKTMRKYLNLTPSLEQVIKDEGENVNTNSDNIKLGIVEDSIFDSAKTFKIRMTSKKTGRKIDLNVKFNIKNVRTSEEQSSSDPLEGLT